MVAITSDLRFGCRILRRGPGLTAAAMATLALGIGAISAVFSIINTVMLRPLPYADPQRLVVMWGTDNRPLDSLMQPVSRQLQRNKTMVISIVPERWRQLSRSFEHIAWFRPWMFALTGGGEPERVFSGLVSADFFACLRVSPAMGRTFLASEIAPGNDHVVVLGSGLWRRRFAADPRILGKSIVLDGVPHTVIGVMPDFQVILPYMSPAVDVWAPVSREYGPDRRWSVVTAVGRLRQDVSLAQAQAEMDAVAKRLETEGRAFKEHGVNLVRLDREIVSQVRPALLILLGAVGCVLLIACANLAGLMLARTTARQREIGIRTVLGAGRGRLVRQLLTESVLLAAIGGALGLALSTWIARAIAVLHPGGIPRLDQVRPDAAVFAFGFAVSVAAGILFGLLPALQFSRANVNEVIKPSGPLGSPGNRLLAPRSLLVVAEIGLALVLLIGAGLLLRSFTLLKAVDPGFNTERLLTMTIPLPQAVYRAPQQQAAFAEQLLERVRTIPSVQSAAVSNSLPMASGFTVGAGVEIEGRQLPPSDASVFVRAVSRGYFRTMGIALLKGRDFTEADQGRSDTVIINQAAARHYWPGSNDSREPIGRQIYLDKGKPRTIIGVAADVKNFGLDADAGQEIYILFDDMPTVYVGLAVRTMGHPGAVAAAVRAVVHGLDRNQTVESVASMREILDRFVARPRFDLVLLGSFAALALVLALVGIYGVVSYSVTQRTHEIGVRMALGAERWTVLRMVVGHAAILAGAGIAVGLLGSYAATRVLQSFLFGVAPHDGATFAAVSVLLLSVCLAASYVPARRAARMDPLEALRYE
jgi:putative ABC transport system permease protein